MAKGSLERQKLTNEKVSLPDDEMSTQISGLSVGRRDSYGGCQSCAKVMEFHRIFAGVNLIDHT